MMHSRFSTLLGAVLMLLPTSAQAQTDARSEARAHFEKGVTAFVEKRYVDAAQEFDLAYAISPAFQVLYNIGQVNVAMERHVQAVRAFEAYLTNGARAIPAERRVQVEAELARQRDFVGILTVRVSPHGADISLDGESVGRSPLNGHVVVVPGPHLLEATLNGYLTERRTLVVGAKEGATTEVTLEPVVRAQPDVLRPPAVTNEPADPSTMSSSGQRGIGYVVGAGGGLLIITGAAFALVGANKANTARKELGNATTGPTYDMLRPATERDYNSGATLNEIGLVGAGLGAVAVGVGAMLVVTAPAHSSRLGTPPVPTVSVQRTSMTLAWSW